MCWISRFLLPAAFCYRCHGGLHLGVSGDDALRYFGAGSLPVEPEKLDAEGVDAEMFAAFTRKAHPVVIRGGFAGTNFDVQQKPDEWTCEAIARRFPTGRMKMEYAATPGHVDNPISLGDVAEWSQAAAPSGAKSDPEAPQYAPFYWGVKGADDGERLWDGKKDLLQQMRKLMRPLPRFMRQTQANTNEVLGSPEFWFAKLGAGAKAHMDSHCESTLTLQLAGRKHWRLSWPPVIANGSYAKDGFLADGRPYAAKGGWKPTHSITLEAGEALLIPPAFVHESKNVGPEECAPSLTFQFADPVAAGFFRHFHPRLRRLGDFNECWERVAVLATFSSGGASSKRLKQLTGTTVGKLGKLDSGAGTESEMASAVIQAAKAAWPLVLKGGDRNGDGKLTQNDATSSVASSFQLQGSLDFHDLNEDGEVTQAEFESAFASWLMTEAVVHQEKQARKTVKHLEF